MAWARRRPPRRARPPVLRRSFAASIPLARFAQRQARRLAPPRGAERRTDPPDHEGQEDERGDGERDSGVSRSPGGEGGGGDGQRHGTPTTSASCEDRRFRTLEGRCARAALACSLALALPVAAQADIYQYVDAEGVVHFATHATDPGRACTSTATGAPEGAGRHPHAAERPRRGALHPLRRVDPPGGDPLPDPRAAGPRRHPLRERLRSARRERLRRARPDAADARHGRRSWSATSTTRARTSSAGCASCASWPTRSTATSSLTIAAYNAGEDAVIRVRRHPPVRADERLRRESYQVLPALPHGGGRDRSERLCGTEALQLADGHRERWRDLYTPFNEGRHALASPPQRLRHLGRAHPPRRRASRRAAAAAARTRSRSSGRGDSVVGDSTAASDSVANDSTVPRNRASTRPSTPERPSTPVSI